jgi:hypothetical protein
MGLLLLMDSPSSLDPPAPPASEVLRIRFLYDLVYRGELREEDQSFLGANDKQTVKRAKIIRIMEAV